MNWQFTPLMTGFMNNLNSTYIFLFLSVQAIILTGCQNNDNTPQLPEITATAAEVLEGDLSDVSAIIDLKLSSAQTEPVSINYHTADSSAVAGKDYIGIDDGSFTFKPGETNGKITIEIISDTIMEFTRKFNVIFSGTGNASITANTVTITITDNDLIRTEQDSDGIDIPFDLPGMDLAWSDEFNGTELNASDWNYEQGAGGWGNNELEKYTRDKENVDTKDGKLMITAVNDQGSYTSARITTQHNQVFQYGLINIRAKLPEGQGIWPALWMLGSSISAVNWPACGEIDIMELLGHEPETVYGTAHWLQGSLQSKGNRFDLAGNSDFSDGYHIFSLLWEENRLVWYVDFNKFFELRKNITDTSWPFNAPFFFILNVAVGGNWPGDPDASTSFPQTMSVDYIRVYQPGG